MKIHHSLLVGLLFLIASLCATVATAAAVDLSTPRAAYRTYTQALADGEIDTLRQAVVGGAKYQDMLTSHIAYATTEKAFRQNAAKEWPAHAKDLADPTQATLEAIEKADVKIDGETATINTAASTEPVRLKRQEGKWKIDLPSMYSEESVDEVIKFRDALADVMANMLPDLQARKYKSYEDLQGTLEMRVKMRLALPQEPADKK